MQETFQIPARWSSADIRSIHVLTPWQRFKRVSAISFYFSTFLPFFIRHKWLFSNSEALCFTFRHNKQASLRPTLPCHRSTVSSRKTLCSSTLLQAICNSFIWYLCDSDTKRRKEIYMCKDLFHTGQSDRAIALWLGRRRTKAGSTVNCPSCWKHRAFRGQEILGRHSSRWHPPYFPWLFHLGYASRLQEQRGNGRNPFPCSHCYTWKPSRQRSKKPACTIWLPLLLTVSSRKVARRKRSMTYWSLRMAWTSLNQNLVLLSLWSRTILTATITRRQSSTASEPSKPMLVTKSRRRGKSASDIR